MEITYTVILAVLAYALAEVYKQTGWDKKYIPMLNLFVGLFGGVLCVLTGWLPGDTPMNWVANIITCVAFSMGAGGTCDLIKSGGK